MGPGCLGFICFIFGEEIQMQGAARSSLPEFLFIATALNSFTKHHVSDSCSTKVREQASRVSPAATGNVAVSIFVLRHVVSIALLYLYSEIFSLSGGQKGTYKFIWP
eukprot:s3289_g2.t1